MLQIRDRKTGGWDDPFESADVSELVTKPMLLLQYNWYKMQEYNQDNSFSLTGQVMDNKLYRIPFQYEARTADAKAALNFHLTQREKINILEALDNDNNTKSFATFSIFQQIKDSTMKK